VHETLQALELIANVLSPSSSMCFVILGSMFATSGHLISSVYHWPSTQTSIDPSVLASPGTLDSTTACVHLDISTLREFFYTVTDMTLLQLVLEVYQQAAVMI
jgi:AraC-like DNA-binding protein